MESINLISQINSIIIIFLISVFFVVLGIFYSKNFLDLNNYLVANRSIKTVSLTMSLVASALCTWVLFGPASAATWGGIGAVIGYALGTAAPFFFLIYLGKTFRTKYPQAKTLIEVINLHFGNKLYKFIFLLSIFYMIIFLIAEVTAVSLLVKYLSGNKLDYVGVKAATAIDFRGDNMTNFETLEKNSIDIYAATKSLYLQNRGKKIKNSTDSNEDDWGDLDK